MLKTYIISLERPTHLIEILPSYGLLPVWSPGVDGKKLTQEDLHIHTQAALRPFVTNTAVGIGMAHMRAWKTMLKSNDPYALVVEDDVVLVPGFYDKLVPSILAMPPDTDILALGCFGCDSAINPIVVLGSIIGIVPPYQTHEDINEYICRPRSATGAHAYIITRQGATRLLEALRGKLYNQIDYHIAKLMSQHSINYYVIKDRIAFQTSTSTSSSTNTSLSYPRWITTVLDSVYIDTMVNTRYLWTLGAGKIGDFVVPVGSFFVAAIGLLCGFMKIPVWTIALVFAFINLGDLPNPPLGLVTWYTAALFVPYAMGRYLTSMTYRLTLRPSSPA